MLPSSEFQVNMVDCQTIHEQATRAQTASWPEGRFSAGFAPEEPPGESRRLSTWGTWAGGRVRAAGRRGPPHAPGANPVLPSPLPPRADPRPTHIPSPASLSRYPAAPLSYNGPTHSPSRVDSRPPARAPQPPPCTPGPSPSPAAWSGPGGRSVAGARLLPGGVALRGGSGGGGSAETSPRSWRRPGECGARGRAGVGAAGCEVGAAGAGLPPACGTPGPPALGPCRPPGPGPAPADLGRTRAGGGRRGRGRRRAARGRDPGAPGPGPGEGGQGGAAPGAPGLGAAAPRAPGVGGRLPPGPRSVFFPLARVGVDAGFSPPSGRGLNVRSEGWGHPAPARSGAPGRPGRGPWKSLSQHRHFVGKKRILGFAFWEGLSFPTGAWPGPNGPEEFQALHTGWRMAPLAWLGKGGKGPQTTLWGGNTEYLRQEHTVSLRHALDEAEDSHSEVVHSESCLHVGKAFPAVIQTWWFCFRFSLHRWGVAMVIAPGPCRRVITSSQDIIASMCRKSEEKTMKTPIFQGQIKHSDLGEVAPEIKASERRTAVAIAGKVRLGPTQKQIWNGEKWKEMIASFIMEMVRMRLRMVTFQQLPVLLKEDII
ncbi:hypothetical protein HPG69_019506 [Diceros bicornis minor]|uniref:Uncharacterized protein n=1 Tax=Diceros bicornis minor TaxID=77932 RepID=A0A7J7F755_DICBM|nr:hypothetical protein HPG69_019506 [Diceros bicornis minor]